MGRVLRSLGIRVLANEHEVVTHGGASLVIAGVHDWSSGQHDLASALAGIPDEAPTILLAHQPKHIDHAVEHEVTLQLSGHTHGGQFFPFNYLVRLTQPFMTGLHQHRGTAIYASPGTGYWGPPMRLGVPAEITELELVVGDRKLS